MASRGLSVMADPVFAANQNNPPHTIVTSIHRQQLSASGFDEQSSTAHQTGCRNKKHDQCSSNDRALDDCWTTWCSLNSTSVDDHCLYLLYPSASCRDNSKLFRQPAEVFRFRQHSRNLPLQAARNQSSLITQNNPPHLILTSVIRICFCQRVSCAAKSCPGNWLAPSEWRKT